MLELQSISKTYRSRRREVAAMQGVTLRLKPGMLAAIRGPSGCGKTTLLLAAGGLLAPDAGEVVLSGSKLYSLSPEKRALLRARSVGFVFQQFHLAPYLSVLENVQVPAIALGTPSAEALARARELVEQFGLGPRSEHLPGELSTGERQRVALARALLNRPSLVLADEPTGNLDDAAASIVLDALARFARDGGAVLLASHDERAAARSGHVWRMKDGRVLDEGAPQA